MRKKMKKTVNLADKNAAQELLRMLYGNDEVKEDDNIGGSPGERGTESVSGLVELPSRVEGILLQE